ncbi:hypothetical protein TNCV_2943451 [Trichonephila clavipes]|nr:hypothetical protein TNCV_2943451 [Trichonephila clavipes]
MTSTHCLSCWTPWWVEARQDEVLFHSYGSKSAVLGPNHPTNIKAGYLNCKIRPYVPNPLSCLKCQRCGHSQAAYRGNLSCSRCASAGHLSTDYSLEQKFQKRPLKPCKKPVVKPRPPKIISNSIEIIMAPDKPKKSTPVQDTSDEEDMFAEEEMNHHVLTPTRNRK